MKKLLITLSIFLLTACGSGNGTGEKSAKAESESAAHGEKADEPAKGPHRGRLLTDGDFTIEVAVFETGIPPEFHLYATRGGKPLNPATVTATVQVTRLDGKATRFTFTPENDYLKANMSVVEPHSFDVDVAATHDGKQHRWRYDSYEGRTTIAPDMAASAGIKTAQAGPGIIRENLTLFGRIQPDPQRTRSVVARFPGPIRAMHKNIGDSVKAGEPLATIESNESLQTYTVTAPIAGVITARNANAGEAAGGEALFVVSDYSQVVAELTVFARDRSKLKAGQTVSIAAADGELRGDGVMGALTLAADRTGQALIARVALDNRDGQWTPGLYVSGEVTIGQREAPLVVANSGLQSFRDFTVVFAKVQNTYEVRMLELGATDGQFTEVLGGLDADTAYVTDNSYLIKADIEKSGASHDH